MLTTYLFLLSLVVLISGLQVFDECRDPDQCPKGSLCTYRGCDGRLCLCNDGLLPNSNRTSCIKGTSLGSACSPTSTCQGQPFSECIDSVCQCIDGYKQSSSSHTLGTHCLPKSQGNDVVMEFVDYNDTCNGNARHCSFDLECRNGTCLCPNDTRLATNHELAASPYSYFLCRPRTFKLGIPINTSSDECKTSAFTTATPTTITTTARTTTTPTTRPPTKSTTTTSTTVTTTAPTTTSTTTKSTTLTTTPTTTPLTTQTTTKVTTPTTTQTTTKTTTPTTITTSSTTPSTLPTTTTKSTTTPMLTTPTTKSTSTPSTEPTTKITTPLTTETTTTTTKTPSTPSISSSTSSMESSTREPTVHPTTPTSTATTTKARSTSTRSSTIDVEHTYTPVKITTDTSSNNLTDTTTSNTGDVCAGRLCPDNSICEEDKCGERRCRCQLGYATSGDGKSCLKLSALGESCTGQMVCQGPFTECTETGICDCQNEYERSDTGKWCRLKSRWLISFPLLGESCSHGFFSSCYMDFEQECVSSRCKCKGDGREVGDEDRHAMYPDIRQCRNSTYLAGEREKDLCKNQSKQSLNTDIYGKAKAKIRKIQAAIIGGSVGFLVLLGIVIGLVVLIRWKRRGKRQVIRDTSSMASSERYSFKIPRPFTHYVGAAKEYDSQQIAYPNPVFQGEGTPSEPKPDVLNVTGDGSSLLTSDYNSERLVRF